MDNHASDQDNNINVEMKLLPASTVRLITSSQVITSVVSVIKELIENALDANSTNIEVKLDNFGFDKIEIRDNGTGIKQSDSEYMAQRHYTSKITTHTDLEKLHTYGFRGEALASLCAVAMVTITTKTADDVIGSTYTLDHQGKITAVKPTPVNQGTTVTVSQLFKNIPVRKQYYNNTKRRKEEVKKVEDLVMAFGLIRPGVRFTLRHDKTMVLQKNKVNNSKSALLSILGTNVMSQMEPVLYTNEDSQVIISGFVPKSGSDVQMTSRLTSDRCFVFVNRRPVNVKEIEKLVRQYYNSGTSSSFSHPRCPVIFLSIIVPPDVVDVNLDPNKTTVLLHNKESILETLTKMLDKVYSRTPEHSSHEQEATSTDDIPVVVSARGDDKTENVKFQSAGTPSVPSEHKEGNDNDVKESKSVHDELSPLDESMIDLLNKELQNFDEEKSLVVDKNIQQQGCGDFNQLGQPSRSSLENVTEQQSNNLGNCLSISGLHRGVSHDVSPNEGLPFCGTNKEEQGSANELAVGETGQGSQTLILQRICSEQSELCQSQGQSNLNSDYATASWSKGHAIKDTEGKTVEPVQLLTGSALRDKETEALAKPSTSSRSPKSSPGRKHKPLELKEGQSTLYDMVARTPVRRPIPAIQYFSKNVKPQVVEENPGLNPLTINKIIADRWETLSDDEKKKYETMATRDVNRYEEKVQSAKRPRTPLNINSVKKTDGPISKRKKLEPLANQTLLKSMMSPVTDTSANQKTESEVPIKVVDVQFDMDTLKEKVQKKSSNCITGDDKLHLIGRMKPHGIWLALRKQNIVVFNLYRVEESLLYHRLMAQHVLPRQPVDIPIMLNPSLVGGIVAWQALLSMRSEVRPPDPTRHYTDDRLLANGFEIQQTADTESGDVVVKIVAMANCLSFYGLDDLQEILALVSKTTANTVAKCRPVKVIHYLKAEAVRMAHNLSSNLGKNDVKDIIDQMQLQLPIGCDKCFHDRPFEIPVHSLNNS
ncbi:PMS1 protein homolog 1-like [Ptychodera flava]|uniref:PMS1 protein homolog 1-like n=1 Tax=Ptychodera flava TaxID=63121 RepID=UPI00396A6A8A